MLKPVRGLQEKYYSSQQIHIVSLSIKKKGDKNMICKKKVVSLQDGLI